MNGFTFDSGALIAYERGERRLLLALKRLNLRGAKIAVPAGVLAQVWRGGRKQARLALFLKSPLIEIEPLDATRAKQAGELCASTGTADVIDASVVLCAKGRGHAVMTSDAGDLARLDPKLVLIPI